jgi:uncharacterized cupredoxin-like copper-binding protein
VRRASAALLAAAVLALAASGCGGGTTNAATIAIRYSQFEAGDITVRAGEPVTFTLRNDDPIEHEWIIGTAEVHEAHRTGTEPYHDTRPSEVTVPPFETRVTTLTFAEPGELLYICHLPGHEAYGMVGTLRVVEG